MFADTRLAALPKTRCESSRLAALVAVRSRPKRSFVLGPLLDDLARQSDVSRAVAIESGGLTEIGGLLCVARLDLDGLTLEPFGALNELVG
jgi:hypothetical protein